MSINAKFRFCQTKPRVFVISDISNEPDDAESLVRYLLYSNEFDTKGIVACTSTHMRTRVCPEDMVTIVKAYGQVVHNLNAHVHPDNQYPEPTSLLELITTGPPVYGMNSLSADCPLSEGARRLGGANVLAQAVQYIHQTESLEQSSSLRSRLRVYAISDQDDCGVWIRTAYPDIFYICSLHGWNQYSLAAWGGISGIMDGQGPDHSKFTREWLRRNIQIGPLGQAYPDPRFLVEGDTPTFLYLIQNGLGSPEHPEWGSWGGRYISPNLGSTMYASNHATIWRWRDAFQNDFAARVQWALTGNPREANHVPVVTVNGSTGAEPLLLEVEAGDVVHLDASATYDPDGDSLSFSWFQYREPTINSTGLTGQQVRDIEIQNTDASQPGRKVKLQMPPPEWCAIDFLSGKPLESGQTLHFVLTVKDNGTPSMVTYKRVVIQIVNSQLRGGRDKQVATVADWLELEGFL
ncbi:hypothetical protein BJY01DRAFT_236810 [Aspergillus pseudoustus]|uniref:DUF1593-domain-containing protein n=1 Tax=Aspergillus pseudoustus TaxID=1810923 RepID=A0ABR4JJH2_9EURO